MARSLEEEQEASARQAMASLTEADVNETGAASGDDDVEETEEQSREAAKVSFMVALYQNVELPSGIILARESLFAALYPSRTLPLLPRGVSQVLYKMTVL